MIRFDDAARVVTLSVRDVAQDGDYRFAGPSPLSLRRRAELGREAHESHQDAREGEVASYRRERSVRYETEVAGWRVVVVGRIDGVYTDARGSTVIEEVKTVLADPRALDTFGEETYPAYARQLRLYRLLLEEGAGALGFEGGRAPEVSLHLVVIALPSHARRTVAVAYDRDACRALIKSRLETIVATHDRDRERREERRARAREVRFPFPELRPHQDDMVRAIEAALRERRPILVSAPAGIGKTVGALVPALARAYEIGGRVFVATSKTTQQKIFADTVRLLREQGAPVRSVVLVAKEKVCLNDVVLCHPDACPYARDYVGKLERSGALDRLARLPVADADAVREEARAHTFCPFEAALDLTRVVDVIIGDYNYVFDPGAAVRRLFVDEDPEDVVLVIDEAHNLYERGAEYYSPELPRPVLRALEQSLAGATDGVRRRIRSIVREIDEHLAALEAGRAPIARGDRPPSARMPVAHEAPAAPAEAQRRNLFLFQDPEAEAIERTRAKKKSARVTVQAPAPEPAPAPVLDTSTLKHAPVPAERVVHLDKTFFVDRRAELDELMIGYFLERRERNEIVEDDPVIEFHRLFSRFASVLELEGDEWKTLYRRAPEGGTLKVLCMDPSRQLGRRIGACAGAVAVSATLEPLEFYRDVLGFDRDETELRAFPSPFDRARRRVVVLDKPRTAFRERDRDAPIVEDAIRAVLASRPGNYIACFPSFEYLEMLAPSLGDVPGYEVIRQDRRMRDAERAAVLARLAAFKGPGAGGPPPLLLLAVQGGIFTEGVDYPGEMCVGAIVVGPGLPKVSFERELVRGYFDRVYGRGFEYAYLYPGMSRVIQSAGRVIRTATDKGVVVLVGDRFATDRYSSLFPGDWYARDPRELVTDDPYGELVKFWAALDA